MEQKPDFTSKDQLLDSTLRPIHWDDYIGQTKLKKNLSILIEAAKIRKDTAIDHVLLYGPAGLGKTTLAHLIAREMNANIKITSGPAIEKVGDLASILTNLAEGDILFIDEVHRLNRMIEEVLYPAMESSTLDIIIGKGPSARTIQLSLPRFTLIAATTKVGLLSSPLRSRFGGTFRLEFYANEEIEKILTRSAKILGIEIEETAITILAQSSRRTPRVANRLLKRVRDFAQVARKEEPNARVTAALAKEALRLLEIDEFGLEATDKKLMEVIIDKFEGGPVGIKSLAAISGEEEQTIEELYEPYLLQLGFIMRTPQGRVVTESGYAHMRRPYPAGRGKLPEISEDQQSLL